MYTPIRYPTMPPVRVARNISEIRTAILKTPPEATIPAEKSRLSPGRKKKIPDSRKTTTKTPKYP